MAPRKKKAAAKKTAKKTTPKKPPVTGVVPSVADLEPQFDDVDLATKDEAIRALMHSLNTDERRVIVPASEAPNTYMLRRPTGIMELDIHLGGGFPAGGLSFISGPDNSGKTWLLLKVMAFIQRIYGHRSRLAFATTEGTFPFDQAIRAGMKISIPDLILEQWQEWNRQRGLPLMTLEEMKTYKEEVGKFFILRGSTGEETLQNILKCVQTQAFQVIGCDSLNGLRPAADADKDLDENEKMAAHASLIGRFLNHYVPSTTGIDGTNFTTLLFTQQVRSNRERANMNPAIQKYIKPWTTTGAWSARHYKLIDLVVSSGGLIKKGNPKEVVGKDFKWVTDKGKAGTHDNLSGSAAFYYPGGTDDVGELLASGIRRGVITTDGRKTVVVRPDTGEILDDFTAPSQKSFRRMIENDFDFEVALRREILTAAGIQCLYL